MSTPINKTKRAPVRTWRPSNEDNKLLDELKRKLGISEPDVLRMGLRRLAEMEGIGLR